MEKWANLFQNLMDLFETNYKRAKRRILSVMNKEGKGWFFIKHCKYLRCLAPQINVKHKASLSFVFWFHCLSGLRAWLRISLYNKFNPHLDLILHPFSSSWSCPYPFLCFSGDYTQPDDLLHSDPSVSWPTLSLTTS